jgi:hypothetical protein
MKVKDLKAQIDALIKADPTAAIAEIAFGPEQGEHVMLKGGIYGRSTKPGGAGRLILAPITLKDIGGF